ncbi:hypothetical protein [Hydrocarboniphaga sp.]|uniref:hypothetical protein n=1 Tax=Hydrocarboniphaga sp. TaxID=2033016 RepID=UPI003D09B6CB
MTTTNPIQPLAWPAADTAPLSERLVTALLDGFDLLGRELGAALLMCPCWSNPAAALLPLSGARDDA